MAVLKVHCGSWLSLHCYFTLYCHLQVATVAVLKVHYGCGFPYIVTFHCTVTYKWQACSCLMCKKFLVYHIILSLQTVFLFQYRLHHSLSSSSRRITYLPFWNIFSCALTTTPTHGNYCLLLLQFNIYLHLGHY